MRRFFFGLAVAMLVAVVVPSSAQADDQAIADHLVQKLKTAKQNGSLKNFGLDMKVNDGVVWFKGHVSSAQQERMVLRTAQLAKNLGVVKIIDEIEVKSDSQVVLASTAVPTPATVGTGITPRSSVLPAARMAPSMAPVARTASVPLAARPAMGMTQGDLTAPAYNPVSSAAAGATYDHPNMPNYSWPSYASHPNYAAVQYPQQYSPSAWPYIGPFYPYPQVPLGWRKVSLEWDDGWWFLDFHDR